MNALPFLRLFGLDEREIGALIAALEHRVEFLRVLSSRGTMILNSFICSSGICELNAASGHHEAFIRDMTPAAINSRRPSSLCQTYCTATSDGVTSA